MLWKTIKSVVIITILLLLLSILAYSNGEGSNEDVFSFRLVDEAKKTVVFIGKIDKEENIFLYATGFLVRVQNICHLLTAKHVVANMKTGKLQDDGMLVLFNSKDGGIASRSIENIKQRYKVNWIFHKNAEVDVAIIPFEIDLQKDDIKVIPDNLFLLSDRLFELYDVFFLSYQPGIEPQRKIFPVIRSGIISIINNDKSFYIDASAFPGNSGSPVFLKPSPIRFDEKGGVSIGGDSLGGKFVGIIGEYVPYREIAISTQTGRPRVIFEENTGLSKVWSVEFINEILDSDTFKEQLNKILSNWKSPLCIILYNVNLLASLNYPEAPSQIDETLEKICAVSMR